MDIVATINNTFTAVDVAFAYLIFSSFTQALPQPVPTDGQAYVFLYRFAHALVANWRPMVKQVERKSR